MSTGQALSRFTTLLSEVDALMPTPPFDYRAARLAAQAELLAEKEAFEKQKKIKFQGYVGLSGPPFERSAALS